MTLEKISISPNTVCEIWFALLEPTGIFLTKD